MATNDTVTQLLLNFQGQTIFFGLLSAHHKPEVLHRVEIPRR